MKISRQTKILEIIESGQIDTQEELVRRLREAGFRATQATVSRDIKELSLVKTTTPDGRQVYSAFKDVNTLYDDRVHNVFRESVIHVDSAYFLVVLHTLPAMAQGAALAIDSLEWPEIVGTIAGDDTIFVAVRQQDDVNRLIVKFRELMKE